MIWVLLTSGEGGFIFLFIACFLMGFFVVTTGCIFEIGLCVDSINQSINKSLETIS